MRTFSITPLNRTLEAALQRKIDTKTKPLGALGRLEAVALQIGLIQQTLEPKIQKPSVVVFAGDHGIAAEPVTAYPQAVTAQMVHNFLNGGAAINVFTRQYQLELVVVNAGVATDLPEASGLRNVPVAKGTKNFLYERAMSMNELAAAVDAGAGVVDDCVNRGCNLVAFGEMGIGNTSSAAMIMSSICSLPITECVGRGAGLDDTQLAKKRSVLEAAAKKHGALEDPLEVLATYGGFETAMLVGAILRAAELRLIILIDGFIVTSALLIAQAMHPEVLNYCIFCHASDERGHRRMLEYLHAQPLLNLGLRLGEGTGAALAFPLVEAAVLFINQMASFESAHVSAKN